MKLKRVLMVTSVLLGGLLVTQLALALWSRPGEKTVRYMASWVHRVDTMEQAVEMSKEIVMGRVMRVQPAKDLVVAVPGEPDGQDRIANERIVLKIEKMYMSTAGNAGKNKTKGGKTKDGKTKGGVIQVFHTGLSQPGMIAPGPVTDEPEQFPPDPLPEPATETEQRSILLDDDPAYKPGEMYALFLMDGPDGSMAPIAPEGRYLVGTDGMMHPMTERGMGPHMDNMPLAQFEAELCAEIAHGKKDMMDDGC